MNTSNDTVTRPSTVLATTLLACGLAVAICTGGCGPAEGSIGAMLGKNHETGRVLVKKTPSDMNAWRGGLRPGDEVLSIDGRDVRYMSAREIHQALVGPVHSKVRLTIVRDGQIMRLSVERGELKKRR